MLTEDMEIIDCLEAGRPCGMPGHGAHCDSAEDTILPNGYGEAPSACGDVWCPESIVRAWR